MIAIWLQKKKPDRNPRAIRRYTLTFKKFSFERSRLQQTFLQIITYGCLVPHDIQNLELDLSLEPHSIQNRPSLLRLYDPFESNGDVWKLCSPPLSETLREIPPNISVTAPLGSNLSMTSGM